MFLSTKNKEKINLSKPRLAFEVESWALNYDKEAENQISVFNEYTDDSYLNNLLPFTDGINHENEAERRLKIREILKTIRSNRSRKKDVCKAQSIYVVNDRENEDKKSNKNNKTDKQKFETISNGMSRAIPGVLQQNITLERTYYNDLILLSKQRYTLKRSMEYQQKIFLNKQEMKGLINGPKNMQHKIPNNFKTKKQNISKK